MSGPPAAVLQPDDPPAIIVRDEGPGVPAHKAEAVFERHSRGKFGDGAGAGLGLSIVRRIMHAHGGQASLMLYEGPGATFQLAFPSAQIEAGANDDAPARAAVAA